MAQIVSASVGRAVAGEIVIPEPVGPAYATWPDIFKHGLDVIGGIYKAKLDAGGSDPDDEGPELRAPRSAPAVPTSSTPFGAGIGGGVGLILIAVVGLFLMRRMF